jgi:hypothetical protein
MSEDTTITENQSPKPQKVKWYNVAYYDNFQQADEHRNNLDGLVKVRRCGSFGAKFVVKSGTLIKEPKND